MKITEALKKILNTNAFDPSKPYVVVNIPARESNMPTHLALNLTPRGMELYQKDDKSDLNARLTRVLEGVGVFIQITKDEPITPNGGHYLRTGKTMFYSIGLHGRHTWAPSLTR